MLTAKQCAERLGISRSLVYALCAAGVIRHTRIGRPNKRGCIRIGEDAMEAYRKACEKSGADPAPLALRHIR